MLKDKLTKNWQIKITSEAEKKLVRTLSPDEKQFVDSREGYIALEMIEDTVNALSIDELRNYLNSEASEK